MSESSGPETTLQRPYLLRAMHEWMTDNSLTPHIVVDVAAAQTALPVEHAHDGRLVLNVSYSATQNLVIGNESASFSARFGGVSRQLEVPMLAILGIYARESNQGMIFSSESAPTDDEAIASQDTAHGETDPSDGTPARTRPELKIIK